MQKALVSRQNTSLITLLQMSPRQPGGQVQAPVTGSQDAVLRQEQL